MGGIGEEAAKVLDATIFDNKAAAVDSLANPGDVAVVRGAVEVLGSVPVEAAERWDNVKTQAAEIGWNVKLDPAKSVTLSRQGESFVSQGTGVAAPVAGVVTALYNGIRQMAADKGLPTLNELDHMDVQVVSEAMRKEYVEKLVSGEIKDGVVTENALIAGLSSGRPVIFMTEEALTKSNYALLHEGSHAFDKEAQVRKMATPEQQKAEEARAEKVAIINGLVFDAAINQALEAGSSAGAVNATSKVSVAALQAAWERNKAQIPQGEFHTRLAQAIANLMNPVGQDDPAVKDLINQLKAQFPEVSAYTIEKDVTEFVSSPVAQMEGIKEGDGSIDPKKVEGVKKKVADAAQQQGATADEA
jgi:hypothetical protein